jgi:hypothetical protein
MTEYQEKMWDTLVSLDSKTLLGVITGYHGMQILDNWFAEYLVDEGLMEPEDEAEEDEDEEDEDEDDEAEEDEDEEDEDEEDEDEEDEDEDDEDEDEDDE